MFGIVFGVACLFGLYALIKRERGENWRLGRRGCRGESSHGSPGGLDGKFGRAALRGLFERLETSPGQERELRAALAELVEGGRSLRSEAGQSRRAIAEAMRQGELDAERLGQLFAHHDDVLSELRKTAVGALSRVHAALDEPQRRELASAIEHGGVLFGRGRRRGYA